MIYLIFLGLFFIFLGAGYMYVVNSYPGYVLISVGNNAIEFNIWFLLTVIVVGGVCLYLLLRLTVYLLFSFNRGFSWMRSNQHHRHLQKTRAGLLAYYTGDWQHAKKSLVASLKHEPNPLMHYLFASRCALQLGQFKEAQYLLDQAKEDNKVSQSTVPLTLARAQILLTQKSYQESLDALSELDKDEQADPIMLRIQYEALRGLGKWKDLLSLLPQLKRHEVVDKEDYDALRITIYTQLLESEVVNGKGTQTALDEYWKNTPKDLKQQRDILGLYCTALHRFGFDEDAAHHIERYLKSQWDIKLVDLYGKLNLSDFASQLNKAERWLDKHKDDAYLLSALGRIAARNSLWGKAKEYFESSLKIKERPEVYAELAELMAKLGDNKRSQDLYQKGLQLSTPTIKKSA